MDKSDLEKLLNKLKSISKPQDLDAHGEQPIPGKQHAMGIANKVQVHANGDATGPWLIQVRPDNGFLHYQARPNDGKPHGEIPYNKTYTKGTEAQLALVQQLISAGMGDTSKVKKSMAGSETRYLVVQKSATIIGGIEIGDPPLATDTVNALLFTTLDGTMNDAFDEDDNDNDPEPDEEEPVS